MGNYEQLKQSVSDVIKTNGNQEITGSVLQNVLLTIISTVGANATFAGIATPATNPGTPDGSVFYLASESGTYTNFNAIELQDGLSVLIWNGSWNSQQIFGIDDVPTAGSTNPVSSGGVQEELALGVVYDVSAKNPTAGVNSDGKFESLSALLEDANLDTLIPISVRKGGMSIKFVRSTDNKYVQFRYMRNSTANVNFTYVANWQNQFDMRYLTEMNVSCLPFSNSQNEVLTKEEAIQRINQIFDENSLPKTILGYRCRYYNGAFVNVVKYTGNGFANPNNWVVVETKAPFPFKSVDSIDKLNKLRYAIKELYVSGEKVNDLKILLIRNYGYDGATNTDFAIGTGTDSSDVNIVERLNLGRVQQKGLQKHIQGRMTVIIDWDLVDFNFIELYSDIYILSDSIYNLRANPTLYADSIIASNTGCITVNANGGADYTSLQDAIDNAGDSVSSPKTILVMPGVYTMPEYDSTTRSKGSNRYLSIIGTDKNNCIIRNDVGHYTTNPYVDNAPLKLAGNVYVANLTIISTDTDYPSGAANDRHKAYCIHLDFDAPQNTICEINNCVMINNHFSCIGFGLRPNYTIKIVNCELTSTMHEGNGLSNYGTLYGHDGGAGSITQLEQHLYVKGCVITNTNGDYGIKYLNAHDYLAGLTFINNVIDVAQGAGYAADSHAVKTKKCFGNNISDMNYTM